MAERIDPPSRLLARKGEARPAIRPDNDNGCSAPEPGAALITAAIALADGRRAAVTLRLDPTRHMRLRLACAIGRRSAQAIMSDALDHYLTTAMPGIERLVAEAMAEGGDQAARGRGLER
jgi:hypothetical protein